MRLCSYVLEGGERSGLLRGDEVVGLAAVNEALGLSLPTDLSELVRREQLPVLVEALAAAGGEEALAGGVPLEAVTLVAPFPAPPKILGIGLNYREHAADLAESSPEEEPASFMKPSTAIVGPGEAIRLPAMSDRVTGEAELAVVIGKTCKGLRSREEAADAIAGYVTAIDMTAEDILRRNPRFLTRAKIFDTFLSLGPVLATPDELGGPEGLPDITVSTVLNGEVRRSDVVANMCHDPLELVRFHSRVWTWQAGDILLTGTPGAVALSGGDTIESRVERLGRHSNPVVSESGTRDSPPVSVGGA